jgi:hypothetical protein
MVTDNAVAGPMDTVADWLEVAAFASVAVTDIVLLPFVE